MNLILILGPVVVMNGNQVLPKSRKRSKEVIRFLADLSITGYTMVSIGLTTSMQKEVKRASDKEQ